MDEVEEKLKDDQDFIDMIKTELDDLSRLANKKANNQSVEPFLKLYDERTKKPRFQTKKRNSFLVETPDGYIFGDDILRDFSKLFSFFNRVAKSKLDSTVLTGYADHKYIDGIFEKMCNEFTLHIKQQIEQHYFQITERMEKMERKFVVFYTNVDFLLSKIERRVTSLKFLTAQIRERAELMPKKS